MIFGWSICIHSWRAIYRWRAVLFKSSSTIWPIPSPPNWHDMQSWIVKHYLLNLRWWMRSILVCPQEWSHDAWVSLLCICKVMQRSNILAIPMLRLQTVSGSSYCKNHPIWHHSRNNWARVLWSSLLGNSEPNWHTPVVPRVKPRLKPRSSRIAQTTLTRRWAKRLQHRSFHTSSELQQKIKFITNHVQKVVKYYRVLTTQIIRVSLL